MKLDVFIPGETIDLCIPTREFAEKSNWYSWFNDPKINRYLDQGLFPNDQLHQVEFYESQKSSSLTLIISNKKIYLGVISLSEIDFIKKRATISTVVNSNLDLMNAPIISMEAIARITEHAFAVMGLNCVHTSQHVKLAGWWQRMELLGYRVEGIIRNGFVKGHEVADEILFKVIYDDYLKILNKRGKYWDSSEKMSDRIKRLPQSEFVGQLYAFFNETGNAYYDNIFNL